MTASSPEVGGDASASSDGYPEELMSATRGVEFARRDETARLSTPSVADIHSAACLCAHVPNGAPEGLRYFSTRNSGSGIVQDLPRLLEIWRWYRFVRTRYGGGPPLSPRRPVDGSVHVAS